MNINNFKCRVWIDDEKRFRYCDYVPTMGFVWRMNGTPLELGENYIQLWTGCKDSNNKEIYEGDVIQYHTYEDWGDKDGYVTGKFVFYEPRVAAYVARCTIIPDETYVGQELRHFVKDCIVTGNMFETPELK